MDGPGQADPGDQPDEPGGETELGGEDRADQGACPRYGGEVMPEEDEPIGWMIVVSIIADVCRRDPAVVEDHDPGRNKGGIVAVRDRQGPKNRENDVEGTHDRAV